MGVKILQEVGRSIQFIQIEAKYLRSLSSLLSLLGEMPHPDDDDDDEQEYVSPLALNLVRT